MCALCGVLGGTEHWTDAAARPGVYSRTSSSVERRRERARRISVANQILGYYGMQMSDWQGSAYILTTATGKAELVDNLAHLWSTAEKLSGRTCDPLDSGLLRRLGGAGG
jgi:hypothetical protein